ncbi:MAG: hypothetical protein CM15mP79_2090 [Methanobacteriota archaeon]|nr:MAG: hypothetical protein CM15mP79_2090 [Euryarchaeota archaeon]
MSLSGDPVWVLMPRPTRVWPSFTVFPQGRPGPLVRPEVTLNYTGCTPWAWAPLGARPTPQEAASPCPQASATSTGGPLLNLPAGITPHGFPMGNITTTVNGGGTWGFP